MLGRAKSADLGEGVQASNAAGIRCRASRALDISLALLESIPESQGLISGSSDDCLTIGAHGEVKHSVGVTGEGSDLCHGRVPPDVDLILDGPARVAVRRDDLIRIARPHEVADLAPMADQRSCASRKIGMDSPENQCPAR